MMDGTYVGGATLDARKAMWTGLAVFAFSTAATVLVSAAQPWPPWLPLTLLSAGGLAALLATALSAVLSWLGHQPRPPARERAASAGED